MQDGARNAFSGYLYQFLGVAALQARAITASDDVSELALDLVACIQNGKLIHELHGQDAFISVEPGGNGESVAIQFKHSRSPNRMSIERSELIDILHAFDRSFQQAKAGGESLDRFVLVTNRRLDRNAQALYEKRENAQTPAELVPKWKPTGKVSGRTKSLIDEYGSTGAAAVAWHSVLKKLSVWTGLHHEAATKRLRELATQHGLSEAEFDAAVGRIISSIVKAIVDGPLEITSRWLTNCLVGAPDAHVLYLSSAEPNTRSAAATALQRNMAEFVRDGCPLVRRRLIDEASEKVRQFPVVWLTGDGGCGKSTLGLQLLTQEASARLTLFLRGRNATRDDSLADTLRPIRSKSHSHLLPQDGASVLLDRVRTANDGVPPPLMLIDVDGLDEVPNGERHGLRKLIDFFFRRHAQSADAVLVLTCRAPERDTTRAVEGLVASWFDTDLPDVIANRVGAVHVGDFDDGELREAADVLAEDVRQRVHAILPKSQSADQMSSDADFGARGPTRFELEILDSLRQPAMWGEFAALPSADRLSALAGDGVALALLADRFLDRFCRKTIIRRNTLREDHVRAGLAAVGNALPAEQVLRDRYTHWLSAAIGPLNQEEAAFLYCEGLSYGLIREDAPGQWRWRHGFVCDRLRAGDWK